MALIQLFSDNFTRADSLDIGSVWDTYTGWANFKIVSNKCRAQTVAVDNGESYNGIALADDQWAEVTIGTWAASANYRNWHASVRMPTPSTLNAYTVMAETPNPTANIAIGEFVAGAFSILSTSAQTVAANDVIRIEAKGTTLEMFQNGVSRGTASDASLSSGRAGMHCYPDIAVSDVEASLFRCGVFGSHLALCGVGR